MRGLTVRPSIDWIDSLLIVAIIAIGPLFYLSGLGFYTDDWPFLRDVAQSADQSISGLYQALAGPANVRVRPLQILLFIFYHKVAPGSLLFPHIVNQVMFAAATLGIFAALRRLPRLRDDAYPLVAVYICLPHYITQRLWYANHQSTLSLVLFAIAFHLIVTISQRPPRGRPLWVAALFLAALAMMLAYELFSFILIATPFFVACAQGKRPFALVRDGAFLQSTAVLLAALAVATAFKTHVGAGLFTGNNSSNFAANALLLYTGAAYTDFWTLGLAMPKTAWKLAHGPYVGGDALYPAAIALAVMILGEVVRRRRPAPARPADRVSILFLGLAGVAGFILGYAPFLLNFFYDNSPFGIDNRGNIGGAVGLAFLVVAAARLVGLYSALLGKVFLIGCCVTGIYLQVAVGGMWGMAWAVQEGIYARLRHALPPLKAQDIVLLYGVCPYAGPTPVFNGSWGLADRLQLDTGIRSLQATTITDDSEARPNGLMVMDDGAPMTLPYRNMIVFDARANRVARIDSYRDAQAFFARAPIAQATGCQYEDYAGVPLYRR